MSSKFPVFFGIAIALVALALGFGYFASSDARLQLTGEILKIRTLELTPDSTLVMLDFRVRNESNVTFQLREAQIFWTPEKGEEAEALTVARPDLDRILQYSKLAGPKYNEVLVMKEKIGGKAMIDRMSAATVPVGEADFEKRKALKLRLTDLDGQSFELLMKKP